MMSINLTNFPPKLSKGKGLFGFLISCLLLDSIEKKLMNKKHLHLISKLNITSQTND